MSFPSFLLQVSTKNKALQDTSQAMGMKDKLVQQKAERYHFGYDSLISFPIIIQPSRCSWIPTMVLKRLFKASFTHFHQLRYVETYWNPKRTAGKAKSINFQTSHFQAAKLQRVPPEQLGPWSFNQHLHWHRTSRINLVVFVYVCSWIQGSLATFLVSWTWSRMVGTRLKPIQYTAQPWQSESAFDGMRHTGDLMILLRCYSLLISYICRNTLTSNQFEIIRMWLQGKWRQFMSSADRCKVLSHREIRFDFVCNLSFQCCIVPPSTRLLEQALHGGSKIWNPVKRRLSGHQVLGPANTFDLFQLDSFDSTFSVLF